MKTTMPRENEGWTPSAKHNNVHWDDIQSVNYRCSSCNALISMYHGKILVLHETNSKAILKGSELFENDAFACPEDKALEDLRSQFHSKVAQLRQQEEVAFSVSRDVR